ncbi:methylated-DNA-protein-cysteine methyltransferase related protein [Halobacillus alkaliphilus]|uniref:Methylated-DNA-protein-cysteine methyltransferase related protein n=1 Tax=Halobacillus alkaliphilus TaxID=396056 RepID=A0A1I2LTK8_9BACI|nr:MGMT family protein [Halobacillus alkaliphilus]SFF82575.1 methylated-DNA-protein-cysteine methyltransferase related protein [Halobacillus alkaliphilus]
MQTFTENVLKIIKLIPEGKVMTYGQIARLAGNPRAARQVSRLLHSMSKKHGLPWHRVINAQGKIAIQNEEGAENQRIALEDEGIPVIKWRINLQEFQASASELPIDSKFLEDQL